jgi:hypothetical protein
VNGHLRRVDRRWQQVLIATGACLVVGLAWRMLPNPALPLGIALLPLILIGVFRAPVLILLLFVCFSFFRLHEAFPILFPLKIPKMLSISAILVLFWNIFITETVKPYWRREYTWLAVFFGLVTIGVPLATNVPIALGYYTSTYSKIVLMVFIIGWLLRKQQDFQLALRMIVIAGMATAYVAISNKLNGIGLVEGTRVTIGREMSSSLGDPNDLSSVLQFPLSFAVAMVLTPRGGWINKLLGLSGIVMLVWAILATQSRGALLGVMAVAGIYGIRYVKNRILLIGGGALAAMVLFAAAGISDRQSGGAQEAGLDASSQGRLHAWEAAIGMATAHPIFGMGLSNFYSNYYAFTPVWDGKNHAVHSTWFGVTAETGFLGIAVFIAFFVALVRAAWGNLKIVDRHAQAIPPPVSAMSQSVFAGLIGTAVAGTFLTMGFTWPIYIAAAFVVSLGQFLDDTYGAKDNERERHRFEPPKWVKRLQERRVGHSAEQPTNARIGDS